MTIQFTQTPVETLVDRYIAEFKPVDTVAIEKQIRDRVKVFEEGESTQLIPITDVVFQTVDKLNKQTDPIEGILMPTISLTRVQRGCSRWDWYKFIGELLANGYTVNNNHKKYFGQDEMVVLNRPESFKETNKALVEAMVSKAIAAAETAAHSAYFDTDKIAAYVEEYQEHERQQYLNRQKAVVDGLISQRLAAASLENEFKGKFKEIVGDSKSVAFNDVKAALGGCDNVVLTNLLTSAGFVKGKDEQGKTVWLKS